MLGIVRVPAHFLYNLSPFFGRGLTPFRTVFLFFRERANFTNFTAKKRGAENPPP